MAYRQRQAGNILDDDYKSEEFSRLDKYIIKYVHAYQLDPEEQLLDAEQLDEMAHQINIGRIKGCIRRLERQDYLEKLEDGKLKLTKKGKRLEL